MKKALPMLFLFLFSCSTADERVMLRRMNSNKSTEKIYRLSHEKVYAVNDRELAIRDSYPWENKSGFAKITMNTLRCRGEISHKKRTRKDKEYEDCNGLNDHGLPYIDGEEFVYPILITLLNKIQNSFNKKVVVTSGHRCPKHNSYITLGISRISKYMIGAKADFYVEGLEKSPDEVIERIMLLYADDEERYRSFQKIAKGGGSFLWKNKEVAITITEEGAHTVLSKKKNPVITIDVRYDRDKKKGIILEWKDAYHGFIVN